MNMINQPPSPSPQPLASAFISLDLGTTTLSGAMIDATGRVLATAMALNPQLELGVDILARLNAALNGQGERLQALLVNELRRLVSLLLDESGRSPEDVIGIAAAGNPGISCLLRNLPVDPLLFPPHKPPFRDLVRISPDEIDIGLSRHMELLPLVSGFVGGDLIACLLAMGDQKPGTLLIDLGTNAELALWDGRRWLVTSAAAGPAFEGGNISSGMIHSERAVTDVHLVGDRLELTVAGGGQPRGLCGSGLVALIAAARQGGLIDETGRILSPDEVETNLSRYLVEKDGAMAICFSRTVAGELLLTQVDLRGLQLAKGAVHAGASVLLEQTGIPAGDIEQVFLTGALGTSLSVDTLKMVALLPEPMLDKTSFMANGVLAGLQAHLMGNERQKRLDRLVAKIQPFPLSGTPAFEKHFLTALNF